MADTLQLYKNMTCWSLYCTLCRQKKVSSRRQLCTHAWQGIQEEAAASAAPGISRNSGAYAGLPFKQWLSPNGQWRVRPMR